MNNEKKKETKLECPICGQELSEDMLFAQIAEPIEMSPAMTLRII